MRSCPQCHLLLESLEWNGRSLQVCRSCGGVWLRPQDLAQALGPDRAEFRVVLQGLPSAASAEAFAGLARPCPDCRTTFLADAPVPGAADVCAGVCPRCGGVWVDATARTSIIGAQPAPGAPKLESPMPALQLRIPIGVGVEQPTGTEAPYAQTPTAIEGAQAGATPPLPFVVPEPADVLEANAAFTSSFSLGGLPREPARHAVVLTCMDSRIPALQMLGLKLGDAHVLRNAGALATDDAIRSLVISHHLLGTQEFYVVGHTGCGMTSFTDEDLLERVAQETGVDDAVPDQFLAFKNVEESVRDQVMRIRMHPWLEGRVTVRGLVYDVETGRLKEVA